MVSPPIQILLVEDNPGDARLLRETLLEASLFVYELTHVDRLSKGLAALQERPMDVVLLDLSLGDAQGLVGLQKLHAAFPALPVVVLTGLKDEALALEAMQTGAQDYLVKGQMDSRFIVRSIQYAIERTRAEETTRQLVREQAQHAIASAERARLHALFMQVPAALCVLTGPDHVYELANPAYLNLVGNRELLGRPLLEALPELKGTGSELILDGVFRTGERFVGKEIHSRLARHPNGPLEDRVFDFVYEPVRNSQGAVEGIVALASEVTEQVFARARIEEARSRAARSEERFQLLAEAIPQIVWSLSADGKEAYLSPRWYDYTGQPADLSLADQWRQAIHPDDYDRCFASWAEAAAKRSLWEMEYRLRRADGVYRWHLGRSLPHCDAGGTILKWYGTATDIDEQRQAIRTRDDLLATVSHDLRNPLHSISLASEILRRVAEQNEPSGGLLKHTATIARAAARMDQLIRDLLDMASIESGHLSLQPRPVPVSQLIEEAAEAIQTLAADKELRLEVEPVAAGLSVFCDKSRVQQVLSNILGNAVKFTPASGRIALQVSAGESLAHFAVTDTGPGIAPDQLFRVFDRFWQAKDTARAGTGLGLAICKGIVEQHHGTIRVESTIGVGTTFFFTLPVASA